MEELQQYVFHFNPFNKTWYAIPRDKYTEYWSNANTEGVLKSSKINTLVELISKGEKFIKSIKPKSGVEDLETYRRGRSKY